MKTMTVQEFLFNTVEITDYSYGVETQKVRKPAVCADGTTLSIQASETHYCKPRVNSNKTDFYYAIEVWCVSKEVPSSWNQYGDAEENPFAYIPIELVQEFVDSCGGIVGVKE